MLEMLGGLTVELTSVTFVSCCAPAACASRQARAVAASFRANDIERFLTVTKRHTSSFRAPAAEPELDQPHRFGRRHAEQNEHEQRREVVRDPEEVAVVV